MEEDIFVQAALQELHERTFGTTEQILNIHKVVYENGYPKILRVDTDSFEDYAIVYFRIKNEKFHLAVYVDKYPVVAVRGVNTNPYHSIQLAAVSTTINFKTLCSLTTLQPMGGWDEGDKKKSGIPHKNNCLILEPDPVPYEFEIKMKRMLDFLESDRDGITRLNAAADCMIRVITIFHNGNTMLDGHHMNKSIISRLAQLDLGIYFDEYAEGKFYK